MEEISGDTRSCVLLVDLQASSLTVPVIVLDVPRDRVAPSGHCALYHFNTHDDGCNVGVRMTQGMTPVYAYDHDRNIR